MRLKVSVIAALLLGTLLPATLPAQSCPCTGQFEWLRQKTALNYAGYRDKVTPQKQAEFERFTTELQTQAATTGTDTACISLMTGWLRWFHDGHLSIAAKDEFENMDSAAIRRRFADWESISLTEARARFYFDQPGREPMEGIYENEDRSYRIALMKYAQPGRNYIGAVIHADSVWWVPGQVKFDLTQTTPGHFTSHYYMLNHHERLSEAVFSDGKLHFAKLGTWYKQYPGTPVVPLPRAKQQTFALRQLDTATLLLTLPTMNESVRLELDSLVKANKALLERSARLIIDCRDNGGGSDVTYEPLQQYVYSGPVKGFKNQTLATDDNIGKYERLSKDANFPKNRQRQFGRVAESLRGHNGEFVGKCGEFTEGSGNVSPNPKRVVILINGGCASSCEQFIYYARQSERVTLMGENTAGILDYGDLNSLNAPCGQFALSYPTTRSCAVEAGQGIDGTGIPPSVRIGPEEKDWVQFALRYLNGK